MTAPSFGPRTAISILLDEAAPAVAAARYELDPTARLRVPLHITLLFPFVRRGQLSPRVVARLREFFAGRPRPAFELARVDVFPGVVTYAAPEPAGELTSLIRDVCARYPETPPYGGAFDEPVPHATLAPLQVAPAQAVRTRVESLLPVRCEPTHASLLEEFEPDRWREREPLPFAG